MATHNTYGKIGEDMAVAYLEKNGYVIKHRNWRWNRKELDIVAQKDDMLIIVEVKSRKNELFGLPEEAVDGRKIRHIISSADAYIKKFCIDCPVRFDIISIIGDKEEHVIQHIENAFFPPIW